MLRPLSEIIKELKLINQDLKDHNDRMDIKYGSTDVLSTSDARTGDVRICCGKCKGECE